MARRGRWRAAAIAVRAGRLAVAAGPATAGVVAALCVVALAAWSGADTALAISDHQLQDRSPTLALLLAVALPLPLLFGRRAPAAAVLLIVGIALLRSAAGLRGPISVSQSVVVIVALFTAEAQGRRRDRPGWGIAGGALLIAGIVASDLLELGGYANPRPFAYAHLVGMALGAAGGGYALRDRTAEAARLEAAVLALRESATERLGSRIAAERRRIAAETEEVVAQLLAEVRPLATRAAAATSSEAFAADIARVDRSAHAALAEMRRVLHLLRADDEPPPPAPAAGRAGARGSRRAVRLLAAAGPVVLLAAIGIVDATNLQPMVVHVSLTGRPPDSIPVGPPEPGMPWPFFTAVACVLPLLARHRAPLAATALVCGFVLGRMEILHLSAITATQFYVPAAAGFLGAAYARSTRGAAAAGGLAIATTVACMSLEGLPYNAFGYSFAVLLPAAATVGGLLVRDRVAMAARARQARDALLAAQADAVRERLGAERSAAAAELHDVVGHIVTVICLHADVATAYARTDLERARAAAGTVATIAGDAERELDRLRAVLADDLPSAPPRSLGELVDAAAIPVTLDQRLGDDELPLAQAHAVYRIVQEALTNVRRHAGRAPARVSLRREAGEVVVEVVNEPGRAGALRPGGAGLEGMRERVALYGGDVEAGPAPGGGWLVRARLRLDAAG